MEGLNIHSRPKDIYGGAAAKYVPPHQRQYQSDNKQTNERLKKQVKGLLNRYVDILRFTMYNENLNVMLVGITIVHEL